MTQVQMLSLTEENRKLRQSVAQLKSGLRFILSKVKTVHDKPPGAEARCPNHVTLSQGRLCKALKRGESILKETSQYGRPIFTQ